MQIFQAKSIGLDIADSTIEIVELAKVGSKINVTSHGRTKLTSNIVERGRIKDGEKLAEILKKLFSSTKPNIITPDKIQFALPEAQVYTHTFTLKSHSKDEREELIQKEAETNIPLKSDDLLYTYKVLAESKDSIEFILFAASREVIAEWQAFFAMLKINIDSFDIETLAIFRGLDNESLKPPTCIMDMGVHSTTISIFDNSGLRYAYSIAVAGDALTKEIAKSLKINEDEAEKQKLKANITSGEKIATVLIKVLEKVVAEGKSSITYFQARFRQEIKEVILVGGTANLKGLSDYLSSNLEIPVRIGRANPKISNIKLVYVGAVGLALKGIEKKWEKDPTIVIKPIENNKKKRKTKQNRIITQDSKSTKLSDDGGNKSSKIKKQKITLLLILTLGAVLIGGAFWYRSIENSKKDAEKKSQQNALESKSLNAVNIVNPEELDDVSAEVATTTEEIIVIGDTPTGFLNAREGPATSFPIVLEVYPDEEYVLVEEQDLWYSIRISTSSSVWITSQYSYKKSP